MEIIRRVKGSGILYVLPLILLSLFTRLRFFYEQLQAGLPEATDSAWYLERAGSLINGNGIVLDMDGLMYLGYYGLLAILLLVFKSQTSVIFIQVVINALSVYIVYRLAELCFNRRTAIISGIIYCFMSSITYWSVYILTDSLFVTILLLLLYLAVRYDRNRQKKYLLPLFACAAYILILRPAGIVSLAFIALWFICTYYRNLLAFLSKHRFTVLAVSALLVTALVYFFFSGRFSPIIEAFESNMKWLIYSNYAEGNIYDVSTKYDYEYQADLRANIFNNAILSFFINNWYNIIILYLKRCVAFLGVWALNVNLSSIAGVAGYLARLGVLIPVAAGIYFIKKKAMKQASLLLPVILSVVFFCVFFFMDASYRYRMPSLPFLGIVAAYGVDRLIGTGVKIYSDIAFTGRRKV